MVAVSKFQEARALLSGQKHTQTCINKRAARERARKRWKSRWPGHCAACEGWLHPDEPCACRSHYLCPRCGEAFSMEGGMCRSCGYRYGEPKDACPRPLECTCRHGSLVDQEKVETRIENVARRRAALDDEFGSLLDLYEDCDRRKGDPG